MIYDMSTINKPCNSVRASKSKPQCQSSFFPNKQILFNKVLVNEDEFIGVYGNWINIRIECFMIVVYAPQDTNLKNIMWK